MRAQKMHTTLGCGAVAGALFVLWVMLAGDLSFDTIVVGLVVAASVASWTTLIDG
jgi:multisubunit Na+/H+ antiporter MnhE subunit